MHELSLHLELVKVGLRLGELRDCVRTSNGLQISKVHVDKRILSDSHLVGDRESKSGF